MCIYSILSNNICQNWVFFKLKSAKCKGVIESACMTFWENLDVTKKDLSLILCWLFAYFQMIFTAQRVILLN